mmetsp:Transcript_36932/g.56724  ORF Transcript_36932/g.56724 Transcript_36932/m.56724 type:complete len:83 (+) Transcript_36932:235-483(+)
MPEYHFPGLKDGDFWCLCAERWVQAFQAGKAPKLYLRSTHERTLNFVPYEVLRSFALDQAEADAASSKLKKDREMLKRMMSK